MYKEVKISNDKISAIICSMGAEFKSIKSGGKELLWDGNPDIWGEQAPILFPICGGLKDDKYIYNGKEYSIPKHGFAKLSEFSVEEVSDNSAAFLLCSNDETRKMYPFDFEFRAVFTIIGNTIKVDYNVTNTGTNTMYYSVGAHEGYICHGGVGNYSIIFEKPETLGRAIVNGNLLEYDTVPVIKNSRELLLDNKYFEKDALVFRNIESKKVTLKNNLNNECIDVAYDCDNLLLWTIPGADYICIEAWMGLPDFVDSDYDLSHKKSIITLEPGKNHTNTHKITL